MVWVGWVGNDWDDLRLDLLELMIIMDMDMEIRYGIEEKREKACMQCKFICR